MELEDAWQQSDVPVLPWTEFARLLSKEGIGELVLSLPVLALSICEEMNK